MSGIRSASALLLAFLRNRLVLLLLMIGAAFLFSATVAARPPSPGKIPNGNVYYCGSCHESGHTFSDGSPPVPSSPVHGNAMQAPFLNTTPNPKTWTADLANQDSDGDGFTNGEELQDPTGSWAIGQPDPGDISFVSNPSDSTTANDTYECDLAYRATPPAPLVLDIIGYATPAHGSIQFGASTRSPLPIDYIRYTVKNGGSQVVYDNFSSSAPFRSGAWNSATVPDGNYTVTALVVEKRAAPGATPRTSTRSEGFVVNNSAPVFGPVGEVVYSPANICGVNETLNGIAAVSSNDIWAVGSRLINGSPGDQMLIKHWDGARWTSVISPNASMDFNALNAVAASSASDVWAVGSYDDGSLTRTLIEHWNGMQWKIAASPNQGSSNNRLLGVAALGAGNAWAVGSYDDGNGGSLPLIQHWAGSSWQNVAAPAPAGASEVTLTGIAAISGNDIWAVGSYRKNGDSIVQRTLTLHWNGAKWSIVASPNPESFINGLNAVAAVAINDIWAVGYASDGTGDKTVALHWNGANWTRIASPSPGSPNNQLLGIAAKSANDIWAVGYANANNDGGSYRGLALHWDGLAWKATTQPYSGENRINTISIAGSEAWAVGGDPNNSATPPLFERYWVERVQQPLYLPLMRR